MVLPWLTMKKLEQLTWASEISDSAFCLELGGKHNWFKNRMKLGPNC